MNASLDLASALEDVSDREDGEILDSDDEINGLENVSLSEVEADFKLNSIDLAKRRRIGNYQTRCRRKEQVKVKSNQQEELYEDLIDTDLYKNYKQKRQRRRDKMSLRLDCEKRTIRRYHDDFSRYSHRKNYMISRSKENFYNSDSDREKRNADYSNRKQKFSISNSKKNKNSILSSDSETSDELRVKKIKLKNALTIDSTNKTDLKQRLMKMMSKEEQDNADKKSEDIIVISEASSDEETDLLRLRLLALKSKNLENDQKIGNSIKLTSDISNKTENDMLISNESKDLNVLKESKENMQLNDAQGGISHRTKQNDTDKVVDALSNINNIVENFTENESEDVLQLRIQALKSAMIRKHLARKCKNVDEDGDGVKPIDGNSLENSEGNQDNLTPYSPTQPVSDLLKNENINDIYVTHPDDLCDSETIIDQESPSSKSDISLIKPLNSADHIDDKQNLVSEKNIYNQSQGKSIGINILQVKTDNTELATGSPSAKEALNNITIKPLVGSEQNKSERENFENLEEDEDILRAMLLTKLSNKVSSNGSLNKENAILSSKNTTTLQEIRPSLKQVIIKNKSLTKIVKKTVTNTKVINKQVAQNNFVMKIKPKEIKDSNLISKTKIPDIKVPKMIINLGLDSDTDDDEFKTPTLNQVVYNKTNENKSERKLEQNNKFEESLDKFLKAARSKIENSALNVDSTGQLNSVLSQKIIKKSVPSNTSLSRLKCVNVNNSKLAKVLRKNSLSKSDGKSALSPLVKMSPQKFIAPKNFKHMSAAKQHEYRQLICKMMLLEKQKLAAKKKISATLKNAPKINMGIKTVEKPLQLTSAGSSKSSSNCNIVKKHTLLKKNVITLNNDRTMHNVNSELSNAGTKCKKDIKKLDSDVKVKDVTENLKKYHQSESAISNLGISKTDFSKLKCNSNLIKSDSKVLENKLHIFHDTDETLKSETKKLESDFSISNTGLETALKTNMRFLKTKEIVSDSIELENVAPNIKINPEILKNYPNILKTCYVVLNSESVESYFSSLENLNKNLKNSSANLTSIEITSSLNSNYGVSKPDITNLHNNLNIKHDTETSMNAKYTLKNDVQMSMKQNIFDSNNQKELRIHSELLVSNSNAMENSPFNNQNLQKNEPIKSEVDVPENITVNIEQNTKKSNKSEHHIIGTTTCACNTGTCTCTKQKEEKLNELQKHEKQLIEKRMIFIKDIESLFTIVDEAKIELEKETPIRQEILELREKLRIAEEKLAAQKIETDNALENIYHGRQKITLRQNECIALNKACLDMGHQISKTYKTPMDGKVLMKRRVKQLSLKTTKFFKNFELKNPEAVLIGQCDSENGYDNLEKNRDDRLTILSKVLNKTQVLQNVSSQKLLNNDEMEITENTDSPHIVKNDEVQASQSTDSSKLLNEEEQSSTDTASLTPLKKKKKAKNKKQNTKKTDSLTLLQALHLLRNKDRMSSEHGKKTHRQNNLKTKIIDNQRNQVTDDKAKKVLPKKVINDEKSEGGLMQCSRNSIHKIVNKNLTDFEESLNSIKLNNIQSEKITAADKSISNLNEAYSNKENNICTKNSQIDQVKCKEYSEKTKVRNAKNQVECVTTKPDLIQNVPEDKSRLSGNSNSISSSTIKEFFDNTCSSTQEHLNSLMPVQAELIKNSNSVAKSDVCFKHNLVSSSDNKILSDFRTTHVSHINSAPEIKENKCVKWFQGNPLIFKIQHKKQSLISKPHESFLEVSNSYSDQSAMNKDLNSVKNEDKKMDVEDLNKISEVSVNSNKQSVAAMKIESDRNIYGVKINSSCVESLNKYNRTPNINVDKHVEKQICDKTEIQYKVVDYVSPLDSVQNCSSTSWMSSDPNAVLCPYELRGSCRDLKCQYKHLSNGGLA